MHARRGRRTSDLLGDAPLADDGRPVSEAPASSLDDERHRSELRRRYYGLLQELRVVLPGVSVLVGLLLTAPFSSRFEDLDDLGVDIYLVSLTCAVASTICCLAPAVYHRVATRTERSARLVWAVRMTVAGLTLLAGAMLTAVFCVTRFVVGSGVAAWLTIALSVVLAMTWIALPVLTGRSATPGSGAGTMRRG